MKFTNVLIFGATLLGALGLPTTGRCQFYQYSNIVSDIQLYVKDSGTYGNASLNITGGSFAENIYIDPVGQTVREVGTLSLSGASVQSVINETRQIAAFPNPPQSVPGTLTVDMSFGGGSLAFDTGLQPMAWNGQAYAFDGNVTVLLPLDLSYSLLTGGQTYTGSADPQMSLEFNGGSEVDTANYPGSVVLIPNPGFTLNGPSDAADFTAANGFQVQLQVVPEPSTLVLAGLGGLALFFFRSRK